MAMKKKKKSQARPGATVTRKITSGPNKGDVVQFKANGPGSQMPGKLVPRRVVKDAAPKRSGSSLPIGKKKKKASRRSR